MIAPSLDHIYNIMNDAQRACAKSNQDSYFMQHAISLAEQAQAHGEVPVGALVVLDGQIIGRGFNQSISTNNPCAHAEVQAIQQAAAKIGNYRVIDATLYVTLEPCAMCAGALVHARIKRLVFGAHDAKTGAAGSVFNIVDNEALNHQVEVLGGVLKEQCSQQLSAFFRMRRAQKKALKASGDD